MKAAELLKIADEHGIHIDEICTVTHQFCMDWCQSIIARSNALKTRYFGAIRYHTTGRKI
jgi:hypothetical protein